MAKAKKKKKKSTQTPSRPAEPGAFNAPFADLKKALKGKAVAEPAPPPPPPERREEVDDDQAFAAAMADVTPMAAKVHAETAPPDLGPRLDLSVDEDLEVLAKLGELVSGEGEFDLRFSDQYVFGALPGLGQDLLDRLARGDFPLQDYLDLHGLGEDEALAAVEAFLAKAAIRGLRHVLLVHGKGLRSPGGVPVLKTALARALSQKRLGRRVLAFCTAQPRDGGEGALYVLLRKWSGPVPPKTRAGKA